MKTKCVNNRNGYESSLTIGREYNTAIIQPGIFGGEYYITVMGDDGRECTSHSTRFDADKDQVRKEAYE